MGKWPVATASNQRRRILSSAVASNYQMLLSNFGNEWGRYQAWQLKFNSKDWLWINLHRRRELEPSPNLIILKSKVLLPAFYSSIPLPPFSFSVPPSLLPSLPFLSLCHICSILIFKSTFFYHVLLHLYIWCTPTHAHIYAYILGINVNLQYHMVIIIELMAVYQDIKSIYYNLKFLHVEHLLCFYPFCTL